MTNKSKKTGKNWLRKQTIFARKTNKQKIEGKEMERRKKQRFFRGVTGRISKLVSRRKEHGKAKEVRREDEEDE